MGNSLPLAPDMATVQRAIGEMLAAVRSGGLLVIHALNLWHLPDGPCVWQKCRRATLPQGEVLIVKGVHRCGRAGLRGVDRRRTQWPELPMQTECVPLVGLEAAELESMARAAGAGEIRFFGGYQDQPYDRSQSVDLLMVAKKTVGGDSESPPTALSRGTQLADGRRLAPRRQRAGIFAADFVSLDGHSRGRGEAELHPAAADLQDLDLDRLADPHALAIFAG